MATTGWFCYTGGSDKNSGGSDSASPRVNADAEGGTLVANVLTTLTDLTAAGLLDTDAVNMVIGGVQVVREIVSHTQFTITLTGGAGNETYTGWRAGGGRPSINKVVGTGAGENVPLAAADTVSLEAGATFTETNIGVDGAIFIRGRGATVDGTGGGAGTDVFVGGIAISYKLSDMFIVNAVDKGTTGNVPPTCTKVRAQACGGTGLEMNVFNVLCSARACGMGFGGTVTAMCLMYCEAGDCTGRGGTSFRGGQLVGCLFYDNGATAGFEITHDIGGSDQVVGCTFEGNVGPGLLLSGTISDNKSIFNNIFSNNSTYGCSAASDIAAFSMGVDYNLYFGNGTAARNNVPVGANDVTTDPEFTNPGSDDYSIQSTGGAFKSGYSPMKNPTLNALNRGAIPGPGSDEETGDYPAEGDVRDGVSYANGTLEGTLSVGTGGGSGIFPSQRRGGPGSRT